LLDCHSRTGILAAQFRYIEQYIEATGIPFTILRSAPLQQNFFDLVKDFQTKLATVSIPIGVGQYAPIHCTDIARVASNIIQDPKKHFGKTYRFS
jgi:uncharacterized protein YbjT (DUF2867 family)